MMLDKELLEQLNVNNQKMTELLETVAFAHKAHGDQKRNYTDEPYIVHPVAVMQKVASVTTDLDMLKAALLHDVVEDTETTLADIQLAYGPDVAKLVDELTDKSKPEDGNRTVRKEIDRNALANASAKAQTIKCADMIDNSKSIAEHDPHFARVYMPEKRALLKVLTRADEKLYAEAQQIVDDYFKLNPEKSRAVSLTEFRDWLRSPEIIRHTWFHGRKRAAKDFNDLKGRGPIENSTMIAKYFHLDFDTRDMKIYGLSFSGWGNDIYVRDGEVGYKNVLDHLQAKFEEIEAKRA